MAEKDDNCLVKLMQIPVMRSAADNANGLYVSVKSRNRICRYGTDAIELGIGVFRRCLRHIATPFHVFLNVFDVVACVVLDEVKLKYPIVLQPTEAVTVSIVQSSLCQTTLGVLDRALATAESFVLVVPILTDCPEEEEEVSSLLSRALRPVKSCYAVATRPLKVTVDFLRDRRIQIQRLSKTSADYQGGDDDQSVLVDNVKQCLVLLPISVMGIMDGFFYIPRYFLKTIGQLTVERSRCRMLEEEEHHETVAEDRLTLDGGGGGNDDQPSIDALNDTLNDSSDPEDEDYQQPSEGDRSDDDSLEFHSGSVVDENDFESVDEENADDVRGVC